MGRRTAQGQDTGPRQAFTLPGRVELTAGAGLVVLSLLSSWTTGPWFVLGLVLLVCTHLSSLVAHVAAQPSSSRARQIEKSIRS